MERERKRDCSETKPVNLWLFQQMIYSGDRRSGVSVSFFYLCLSPSHSGLSQTSPLYAANTGFLICTHYLVFDTCWICELEEQQLLPRKLSSVVAGDPTANMLDKWELARVLVVHNNYPFSNDVN